MKKFELVVLRDQIKNLTEMSRSMNPLIQAAKGLERHELRVQKSSYSTESRSKLLAYAFLRGVPYRVLERNCESPVPFSWTHEEIFKYREIENGELEAWLAVEETTSEALPVPEAAQ